MANRKFDRTELMDIRVIWPEPLAGAMSAERKALYEARKRAVDMYIDGETLEEINSKTGIDKSHIVKYVSKCYSRDGNGNFTGYAALCPWKKTKGTGDKEGVASNGRFLKLLECHEELIPFIEGNYFGYEKYTLEKNMSLTRLHGRFVSECLKIGIGPDDYPLNTASKGYQALRRYVKSLEAGCVKLANRRTDEDSARKAASTGYGENYSPSPVAPFSCGQIDGHKIDLLYITQIELDDGTEVNDVCERCWFLPVIDVATRCIVGYHMSQETNYNQHDICKAVKNTILPHRKMNYTLKDLENNDMDGFPSSRYPELEYAMFDEIMLDNAKSHLTDHVMDTFTEKLGITLNYGAVSTPETRGIVERFFKTIEIKGFHTLPGTTGSNSRDIKAKDARKQAIKYGITFDEVCQIMEYLICEYNNTPHSTLLNRTPLEVMGERLEQGMLPHIASDMEKKEADRMLFFDKEVTVRGSIKSGKRPHINYLGARYRGDILSVNYEFLGKKLFLRIDPDDISSIEAYSEDCDYIEKIRAVGEYGHKKHSIVTRKLAIKYANANKKEHSDFETPLTDLEQSLKKRAAKSKKARTRVDIMQREQDAKKKGPGRKKKAELIPIDPKAREKDRALDPKVQDMTSEETWIHMLSNKERRSL